MNSTSSRVMIILVVMSILFTLGIDARLAQSAAGDNLSAPVITSFDPLQRIAVIPGMGWLMRMPGEPGLVHGDQSDPTGRKIMEILDDAGPVALPSNGIAQVNEIMVTNTADSGMGSLRDAIDKANIHIGPDVIHFSLSGMTIQPLTDLPPILDNDTVIDASPRWMGSWPTGKPGIKIHGGMDTTIGSSGLLILGAQNVIIKGLEIQYFNTCVWMVDAKNTTIGEGASTNGGGRMLIHNCAGPAVFISGGQENHVIGSYIGTSDSGNLPDPNSGEGIFILNSAGNEIGGPGAMEGNIIGASDTGIRIVGTQSISNTVIANQIGVGMLNGEIPNQQAGVYIGEGASYNSVGGQITKSPGSSIVYTCTGIGNEIQHNGGNGVTLTGAGNLHNGVMDNYISENNANGIEVSNQAQDSFIGCNNIVSSVESGIFVQQADTNWHWIIGNFIGINMLDPLANGANGKHGIGLYDGTSENLIDLNYIGNNGWSGVAIVDTTTSNNELYRNHIGIGMNGEAMGNAYYGVDIIQSRDNTLTENTITNNGTVGSFAGVHIRFDTAVGNGLFRNSIYNNSGMGIELTDRAQNEITPPAITSADCPLVSGVAAPVGGLVQIFSDSADEGRYYEGSAVVNGQNQWIYMGSFHGPNLTATVFDNVTHDSSIFSPPWSVGSQCHVVMLPIISRK